MSEERNWHPSCMGEASPTDVRYRILTDGDWFYIECKGKNDEAWQGGLAGRQSWLGLSDEECRRAYPMKRKGTS